MDWFNCLLGCKRLGVLELKLREGDEGGLILSNDGMGVRERVRWFNSMKKNVRDSFLSNWFLRNFRT